MEEIANDDDLRWASEQVDRFMASSKPNADRNIIKYGGIAIVNHHGTKMFTFRLVAFIRYLVWHAPDRDGRVVTERGSWKALKRAGAIRYRLRIGMDVVPVWGIAKP